jgi:hypothetical protein
MQGKPMFVAAFGGLTLDEERDDEDETGGMDYDNSPSLKPVGSEYAADGFVMWTGIQAALNMWSPPSAEQFAEIGAFADGSAACERTSSGAETCSMLAYESNVVARGASLVFPQGDFPSPVRSRAMLTRIYNVVIETHPDAHDDWWQDGEYLGVPVSTHLCVLAGVTGGGAESTMGDLHDSTFEIYPDSNGSFIDYRVRITPEEVADESRVWVECWPYDQV